MALRYDFAGFGGMFKYLKLRLKAIVCDFYETLQNSVNFCTENDSKALALCAARSHIGAVR